MLCFSFVRVGLMKCVRVCNLPWFCPRRERKPSFSAALHDNPTTPSCRPPQAVAWRFTPGGRALIDRRRRSRVERNVRLVVQHLEMEGGIPFGPRGIGAILARVPEIMLCKPTTNDRWDRRAVELVAYQHQHGHCNVPEVGLQQGKCGCCGRDRAEGCLGGPAGPPS